MWLLDEIPHLDIASDQCRKGVFAYALFVLLRFVLCGSRMKSFLMVSGPYLRLTHPFLLFLPVPKAITLASIALYTQLNVFFVAAGFVSLFAVIPSYKVALLEQE